MKRVLSLIIMISMIMTIGVSVFAERVMVKAGGTAYTSNSLLTGNHSTYYCQLDGVKFSSQSENVIPTGYYVNARVRTSSGTQCGDLASFSVVGYGYNYNYWSGYGHTGYYKLATNSSYYDGYRVDFTWNP
ncbi:MAG: hypothetical protein J5685_08840 [Clostridiales bacterium]|nr:hypothetical protein [Clostridiales bacterium]